MLEWLHENLRNILEASATMILWGLLTKQCYKPRLSTNTMRGRRALTLLGVGPTALSVGYCRDDQMLLVGL